MSTQLSASFPSSVRAGSGRSVESSTPMEVWQGLSAAIVDQIADNWEKTQRTYKAGRMEHYFSAEFLMGRALLNNLSNLKMIDQARAELAKHGHDLSVILEEEPDAALGNGGLGRLAACFLDSTATLDLPVAGYGILYRYGLFKQLFNDGFQTEHPDPWMEEGYPFVIRHEEDQRPDAALGNGGLGRLAACFLDSTATLDLPVAGYGILYRYGLFKQLFNDGFQTEHPDPWMEEGYPFVIRHEEDQRLRSSTASTWQPDSTSLSSSTLAVSHRCFQSLGRVLRSRLAIQRSVLRARALQVTAASTRSPDSAPRH